MKIVIAGNYRQYKDYLLENNLTPQQARYVDAPEKLRGLRGVEVVKYGEWWLNPCANDWYLEYVTLPITSIPNKQSTWLKNLVRYIRRRFYIRGTTWLGLINTLLAFLFNRVLVKHSNYSKTVAWSIRRGTDCPRTDDEIRS